jgi:tight adherence protein B
VSAAGLAAGAGVVAAVGLAELAAALEARPTAGRRAAWPTLGLVPPSAPLLVGAALVGGLLLGWIGLAVGAATGALAIREQQGRGQRRSVRARERGTGALARSMGDALRAGRSIRGALDGAAADRSVPAPLRADVAQTCATLAHGAALREALAGLARGGGPQLTLLAAVTALHAEQGGGLVRELHSLAEDADRAVRLDEERAAATAQARATVRTVALLPLVALAGGQLIGGDLLGAVAQRPAALALLTVGLLLELAAVLLSRRLVAQAA